MIQKRDEKLKERNKKIKFLEGLLKEKVPNYQLIANLSKDDLLSEGTEDDDGSAQTEELRIQLDSAQLTIQDLHKKIAFYETQMKEGKSTLQGPGGDSGQPSQAGDAGGSTGTPQAGSPPKDKQFTQVDFANTEPMLSAEWLKKIATGQKISPQIREKLFAQKEVSGAMKVDILSVIERFEADIQALQAKIKKMKVKFTSFIAEFKKSSMKELENLESFHSSLITKAVHEEKEDPMSGNVELLKILSFLHIENRKLKSELKNLKQEYKEKQDEWADQREKLREGIDSYGAKMNRLQAILNKFLASYTREPDTISGSRSTIGGGRVLDWKVFADNLDFDEEGGVQSSSNLSIDGLAREAYQFQNVKKTIKGNKKTSQS